MNTTLYIGNLEWSVTDAELKQIFEPHVPVRRVRIVRDGTGRSMGFGFVDSATQPGFESGLALDGTELKGRNISVKPALKPMRRDDQNGRRERTERTPDAATDSDSGE